MAVKEDQAAINAAAAEEQQETVVAGQTPEPEAQTPEPQSQTPEPVAQTPEPAEQWEDIRDFAKKNGLDISHIADPSDAAKYLIEHARNNTAYAQLGQQLAPYWSDIQQFLAQRRQAQPAAPQAQQPKRYFGLPEYDPQWLDWLDRDAAGNIVPKIGAPPDIVGKVTQYHKALANFQNQFWQKPDQFLGPMIQDAVAPLVQQAIQQNMRGYQDGLLATNFIAQNTNWLHYHDAQGNVLRDPITGSYALTPEGNLFVTHLRRAEQFGIRDMQAQQAYAMDQMKLAYLSQQAQQQQAVQQGAAKNQQLIQERNRRAPNTSGSLNAGPGMSQNKDLALRDRLRNALTGAGINDAALVADTR